MLNRLNIFSRHPETPAPLTRFQSAVELKDFSVKLEALRSKYNDMKKSADSKGAQSNEYSIYVLMGHLISTADEEIKKFNESPAQADYFLNVKDMLALTDHIKPVLKISEKDLKTLNTLPSDTHYVRNTTVGLAIVSMPVVPFFIYGVGAVAAFCCVSGILSYKPTEDWLKSIKVIDGDTISKTIVDSYINTVIKINENLASYIEANQELHDKNTNNATSLKLV